MSTPIGPATEPSLAALRLPSVRPELAVRQGEFASVLARGRVTPGESAGERRAAAREGAEEFVAMTLVQPLLKQLRDTSQAAEPFKPSSAELQFRTMLDAQTSLRLVKAAHFPLVDVVARSIERQGATP